MNALNILSGLSPPPTPGPTPSPSRSRKGSTTNNDADHADQSDQSDTPTSSYFDSFDKPTAPETAAPSSSSCLPPAPPSSVLITTLALILDFILSPFRYLVAAFYAEDGSFSLLIPMRSMRRLFSPETREFAPPPTPLKLHTRPRGTSVDSIASSIPSDEEGDLSASYDKGPAHHTRSKSAAEKDEIAPAKRSIRIKLHNNEDALRRRRQRATSDADKSDQDKVAAVANSLKSPSNSAATKLRYPRAPAPPRPLVPRRQPSYVMPYNPDPPKKTLILDLDETLIHSMAKGGRMSTGHMVEVKLQGPIGGNGMVLGPQVPILYYVHERPYCHDFLRKVITNFALSAFRLLTSPFSGLQMVQSHNLYCICARVRRSRHRLG
jgi:CTD nuclear envelope phosphatase 1